MTKRKADKPTKANAAPKATTKRNAKTSDRARQRELSDAMEALRLMDEESRRRRGAFEDFVRANKHLPWHPRAEAWLRFVAADPEGYGDQEALIYLVRRGEDFSPMIQSLVEDWRRAEQ